MIEMVIKLIACSATQESCQFDERRSLSYPTVLLTDSTIICSSHCNRFTLMPSDLLIFYVTLWESQGTICRNFVAHTGHSS